MDLSEHFNHSLEPSIGAVVSVSIHDIGIKLGNSVLLQLLCSSSSNVSKLFMYYGFVSKMPQISYLMMDSNIIKLLRSLKLPDSSSHLIECGDTVKPGFLLRDRSSLLIPHQGARTREVEVEEESHETGNGRGFHWISVKQVQWADVKAKRLNPILNSFVLENLIKGILPDLPLLVFLTIFSSSVPYSLVAAAVPILSQRSTTTIIDN
ncbi:hypothetical protein KQX54_019230 [Cotesia glomerata]|uniref:Uncharacterized protein n=1 Tax=Cotesia glomerata TaxID=32391 RepID=A0AAV7HYW7_COTGL|nr:hypothetical protein KQX54_019230 [Cotesia glomerata]